MHGVPPLWQQNVPVRRTGQYRHKLSPVQKTWKHSAEVAREKNILKKIKIQNSIYNLQQKKLCVQGIKIKTKTTFAIIIFGHLRTYVIYLYAGFKLNSKQLCHQIARRKTTKCELQRRLK